MMATSLSFALMRFYASFHGRLLREHIEEKQARAAMIMSGIAPVLYAVAIGLSFVWPLGAIGIQVLVLAIFFIHSPSRNAVMDTQASA
jgi:hypothetical protein